MRHSRFLSLTSALLMCGFPSAFDVPPEAIPVLAGKGKPEDVEAILSGMRSYGRRQHMRANKRIGFPVGTRIVARRRREVTAGGWRSSKWTVQ